MIERLMIATAIVIAALLMGMIVRSSTRRHVAGRSASAFIDPTESLRPKLLVFSSKWCSDCVTQRSVIEKSRDSWDQPVEISYHDAIAENDLARRFGILMVPALVV